MTDMNDWPDSDVEDLPDSPDEIPGLPHLFELDLDHMAVMNLRFTLDGIGDLEKELAKNIDPAHEEDVRLRSKWNQSFCNDLRLTAYRMAVVTLVTRFQHWISMLVKAAQITVSKKRNDPSTLMVQLEALNQALGDGPIPFRLFDELEEIRNSVIHADSKAEWESMPGKYRKVADAFKNANGEVEIREDQLQAAVSAMIVQVGWYEGKIAAQGRP